MIWKVILGVVIIGLIFGAVRSKAKVRKYRNDKIMEGAVASPASVALGEMVAVAGGIYLSLSLLASFLKITTPDKVALFNLAMDPLALFAITIAVFQPIFLALYYKLRKSH